MKFDFGEVLGQTWKIGWNHKVLWLCQTLPGLFYIFLLPFSFITNPIFAELLPEPLNQIANDAWPNALYVTFSSIWVILMIIISVIAQLATTYGALKVEKGAEKLALRQLLSESLPYFWRVVGLYFIFGGAWMLLILAFMAVNMLGFTLSFGLAPLCLMPFFLLLFPIALVGWSVLELAQAAVIADDMSTTGAISHGWKLFRANALHVTLLMVILYFGLYILSSVIIFPMMLPMMLFPLGLDAQGNFNNFMPVFFIVFIPLMFIVMITVQGILMAFFQSAWAVAYTRFSDNAKIPIGLQQKPQVDGIN